MDPSRTFFQPKQPSSQSTRKEWRARLHLPKRGQRPGIQSGGEIGGLFCSPSPLGDNCLTSLVKQGPHDMLCSLHRKDQPQRTSRQQRGHQDEGPVRPVIPKGRWGTGPLSPLWTFPESGHRKLTPLLDGPRHQPAASPPLQKTEAQRGE